MTEMNDDEIQKRLSVLNEEFFPKTSFEFEVGSALLVVLDLMMPGYIAGDQCYCDRCTENLLEFALDVMNRWQAKYHGHIEEFIGLDHASDD